MSDTIKWDIARRSYVVFTGQFKRIWAVKYVAEKIKSIVKNSEECAVCKCNFPIDAIYGDTFFLYITIDGEKEQDVEACDARIFGEIFKELESLGIRHRVSHLSYPRSSLRTAHVNMEG